MKISIAQPNEKGQVVIPKEIRDSLGINKDVPLRIMQRGKGIYLQPIKDVITDLDTESSFLKILDKTQGAWAKDDWKKTEKKRKKIELSASRIRKILW